MEIFFPNIKEKCEQEIIDLGGMEYGGGMVYTHKYSLQGDPLQYKYIANYRNGNKHLAINLYQINFLINSFFRCFPFIMTFLSIFMAILIFIKIAINNVISYLLKHFLYCRGSPLRLRLWKVYILPKSVLKGAIFPVFGICWWEQFLLKETLNHLTLVCSPSTYRVFQKNRKIRKWRGFQTFFSF